MSKTTTQKEKILSKEILSVLLIVSADFYLQQSTKQFINIEDQTIQWDALFKLPVNESHKAAITWAYCILSNELPSEGQNPFKMAASMDANMKKVILEALKFRWTTKV